MNELIENSEKYCSGCKTIKPVSEFYKRRDRPNGYASKCKVCRNTYHAEYLKTKNGKDSVKKTKNLYWQRFGKAYAQTPNGKAKIRNNNAKYRQSEKGKRAKRNYELFAKYGITLDQFEELFQQQGQKCAICGNDKPLRGFHLDHCHKTNKVRGILCHTCNSGLGLFKDNPDIFLKAADYLQNQSAMPNGVIS
mgnify:CR=1 FL=1